MKVFKNKVVRVHAMKRNSTTPRVIDLNKLDYKNINLAYYQVMQQVLDKLCIYEIPNEVTIKLLFPSITSSYFDFTTNDWAFHYESQNKQFSDFIKMVVFWCVRHCKHVTVCNCYEEVVTEFKGWKRPYKYYTLESWGTSCQEKLNEFNNEELKKISKMEEPYYELYNRVAYQLWKCLPEIYIEKAIQQSAYWLYDSYDLDRKLEHRAKSVYVAEDDEVARDTKYRQYGLEVQKLYYSNHFVYTEDRRGKASISNGWKLSLGESNNKRWINKSNGERNPYPYWREMDLPGSPEEIAQCYQFMKEHGDLFLDEHYAIDPETGNVYNKHDGILYPEYEHLLDYQITQLANETAAKLGCSYYEALTGIYRILPEDDEFYMEESLIEFKRFQGKYSQDQDNFDDEDYWYNNIEDDINVKEDENLEDDSEE